MSETMFEYNSSKEYLARLLATENIGVVRSPSYNTASFDLQSRTMHLPIWRTSEEVYDLLTIHEMAHALYTPPAGWHTAVGDDMNFKSYLNIIEDARIEKLIKRRFAGAANTFREGYARLNEDDFFGIKKHSIDVETATLIDRINIYYKMGSHIHVPFTDEEREWLVKIDNVESWEDVEKIARALYAYAKEQAQTNFDEMQMQLKMGKGNGKDADGIETDMEMENDSPGKNADVDGISSLTDREYRDRMHNLENNAAQTGKKDRYLTISKIDPKKWIVSAKKNREILEKAFQNVIHDINRQTTKMLNQNTAVINSMVKEFEAKKRASSYARAQYSKTGRLDMKKLAKYQLAEDIFRRNLIEHKGKNHSMVMIVDWSGSMSNQLVDTVIQTINLAMFCRKVGIPFSVQLFCNSIPDWLNNRTMETDKSYGVHNRVTMCEMLSSESSASEFKRDVANLYGLAMWQAHVNWSPDEDVGYDYGRIIGGRDIDMYRLNGTPLNAALFITAEYVKQFRARYKSEVTNVIILTDGESGNNNHDFWHSEKSHYFDPTTGITYRSDGDRNWETHFMYDLIRDRNQGRVNIVGYYISHPHDAIATARQWSRDHTIKMNNGFCVLRKTKHFRADRFFIVSSKKISIETSWDFDFDQYIIGGEDGAAPMPVGKQKVVKDQSVVTKDLKKSFKDHMKSKRDNRIIVAKFIDEIAAKIA